MIGNKRLGSYNHRIAIQESSFTTGTAGRQVPTWTTVAEVWASKEYAFKGNEVFRDGSNKRVSAQTFRYRTHYRDDISFNPGTYSVLEGGIRFDILNIYDEDGDRRELTFYCEQIQ